MQSKEIHLQQIRFSMIFGFFAGMVVWLLQLFVGYSLVPVACQSGSRLGLYLVSGVAGVIILIAGIIAYRNWRNSWGQSSLPEGEPKLSLLQFIAASGVLLNSLFLLVIAYTGVAQIFLSACPVNTMPFP